MTAAPRLRPLVSVQVVLRSGPSRVQVDALPHVAQAISCFLDRGFPKFWSLPRACEANFLSLLPRLAARGISNGMDPYYWKYQCNQGLVSALKHDNLKMIEWLHECCPSVLPYNAMTEATKTGNLRLLKILAKHQSRERRVAPADDGRNRVDRPTEDAPTPL